MFNKKSVIILTVLISLIFSAGVSAQYFDDVPRDHWAYDSVQTLAEKGYLSLYAGEDFNGEEPLSRYEMAEIITNVLENTTGAAGTQKLSEEDVDVVRELSLEFRDELVAVAERQKKFEARLKNLEDTNQIQDEDIANINVRVSELEADNQAAIEEIDRKIASLEAELAEIQDKGLSGKKLQDLEDNQSVALTRIQQLENRISELEAEKETAVTTEKSSSGDSSINIGYVFGALAVLALAL